MASELLVFDDDPEIVDYISTVAREREFSVRPALKSDDFWQSFDQMTDGAIVLDLELGDATGISVLRELAERKCMAPILLISGYHSEILKSAARIGNKDGLDVRGSLQKPFRMGDLVDHLTGLH